MVGARNGSRWSAPGAAICWQPVSLAAMSAAQRGHHRVLLVSDDHHGRYLDLGQPGVCGRVGALIVAEPEEGISCPADLGLRGLVGTGSCPGPQAQVGEPIPVPS